MGVIDYHWLMQTMGAQPEGFKEKALPGSPLIGWPLRVNQQSSWNLLLFCITSGYGDRVRRKDPLRMQLQGDLFVLFLYLATAIEFRRVNQFLFRHVLMNPHGYVN